MKIEHTEGGVVVRHEAGDMKNTAQWNAMRRLPADEVPVDKMSRWVYVAALDMSYETGIVPIDGLRRINAEMGHPIHHSDIGPMASSVFSQVEKMRHYSTSHPEKVRRQLAQRATRFWDPEEKFSSSNQRYKRSQEDDVMTTKTNGKVYESAASVVHGKESKSADAMWRFQLAHDKFDTLNAVATGEMERLAKVEGNAEAVRDREIQAAKEVYDRATQLAVAKCSRATAELDEARRLWTKRQKVAAVLAEADV